MLHKLTLLSALLLASACTSVDSDSVFTSGLYAQISASSNGGGETLVKATLFLESPGSLNYIELEGDDVLTAYGPNGESKIMSQSQFLGITSYSATFEGEDADSEFIVEFTRTIDDSAPDSRVTLPSPFDITTAEGGAYSRATDDITIDWTPSGSLDDVDYTVRGTCIEDLRRSIEGDPGTLTLSAGDIVKREGDMVDDTCTVVVTIARARAGIVDANYGHGGDAFGYQTRDLSFTTNP